MGEIALLPGHELIVLGLCHLLLEQSELLVSSWPGLAALLADDEVLIPVV